MPKNFNFGRLGHVGIGFGKVALDFPVVRVLCENSVFLIFLYEWPNICSEVQGVIYDRETMFLNIKNPSFQK